MSNNDALREALDLIDEIVLAGMSGSGQESEEVMLDFHARKAWKFINIAARAKEKMLAALAASKPEPQAQAGEPTEYQMKQLLDGLGCCHSPAARHAFLLSWIRDWTNSKLQSNREALEKMKAERDICEKQADYWQNEAANFAVAIAKKDAALQACVDVLSKMMIDKDDTFGIRRAIAKAQDALK